MSSSADSSDAVNTIVSEIASKSRLAIVGSRVHRRQTEIGGSEDPEDRSVADALTEAEHFEQGVVPVDERITEIARVEQPDQQGQPCATDRTDRDAGDSSRRPFLCWVMPSRTTSR